MIGDYSKTRLGEMQNTLRRLRMKIDEDDRIPAIIDRMKARVLRYQSIIGGAS